MRWQPYSYRTSATTPSHIDFLAVPRFASIIFIFRGLVFFFWVMAFLSSSNCHMIPFLLFKTHVCSPAFGPIDFLPNSHITLLCHSHSLDASEMMMSSHFLPRSCESTPWLCKKGKWAVDPIPQPAPFFLLHHDYLRMFSKRKEPLAFIPAAKRVFIINSYGQFRTETLSIYFTPFASSDISLSSTTPR